MSDEELERQIVAMSERGIGGFFIHSRAGLTIPYMEKQWFHAVQVSLDCAERCGLDVWLYDEDGWPSGFAGGKVPKLGERYQMKYLKFSQGKENIPVDKIIARYRRTEKNEYMLDQNAEDLIAYYVSDRHYVDLLDEQTTIKFIENTHELYRKQFSKYFGNVIKGIFTDEPQLYRSEAWSFCLCDAFLEEYGEPLLPQLWRLYTERGKSILRYKLGALRAKLFTQGYICKIAQWCKKNHLLMTGHLADEDGLCMSAKATGGTIANYREMQMPGIDFLGKRLASPVLLKQVQSAKNQFGKPYILSETFGCCGWNTSFSDYMWIWGYQAAFGINTACLHIGAYSITGCRKRDYPAFFSYHEPWWGEFASLNRWMYEVNRFLSGFAPRVDILVLSPLQNVFAYDNYAEESRRISNQFRILTQSLIECQVGFDIGDETVLQAMARTEQGKLIVGKGEYTTVIVPEAESLKHSTWRVLEEFSLGGGKVIFTNTEPTLSDFSEFAKPVAVRGELVMNRPDLWGKYFRDTGYERLVRVSPCCERYSAKDVVVFSGKNSRGEIACFIVNISTESEKELLVRFHGTGDISEYDFQTGTKRAVVSECCGESVYTKILLPKKGVRCYVLGEGAEPRLERKISENFLAGTELSLSEPNCLTLDTARYSVDGDDYSEQMPVIHMQQRIYRAVNSLGRASSVRVLYEFEADYMCGNLTLWLENQPGQALFFNGQKLRQARKEHWLDREIAGYDVAHLLKKGQNELVIENLVAPYDVGFDPAEVFETEKNRFYYPVEFENIYLRGDFGIQYTGYIRTESGYYRLQDGKFLVGTVNQNLRAGDLTRQSFWFYRGKARYNYTVIKSKCRQKVRFIGVEAPVANLYVNGKSVGSCVDLSQSVDITQFLHEGRNAVCVELCSSNRNLLGPHHHTMGEVDFVGVNTFKGTKGYEDTILNPSLPEDTFTEAYSFVRFGMDGMLLEEWEEICG